MSDLILCVGLEVEDVIDRISKYYEPAKLGRHSLSPNGGPSRFQGAFEGF